MSKVTFFKTQFPTENVTETSPARLSENGKKFVDYDLNIGWALKTINSYSPNKNKTNLKAGEARNDHRVIKKCQGALRCLDSSCALYRVNVRPPIREELIAEKTCYQCGKKIDWLECNVNVKFNFSASKLECVMQHIVDFEKDVFHTHGLYAQKHLTQDQLKQVDDLVTKFPTITPTAAITGIVDSNILDSDDDIEDINPILLNRSRAKSELTAAKIRCGISSNGADLFAEFVKIEEEYPDHIISAQLVSSKFCIIFNSPEMTMIALPFRTEPMITDVTYAAVCGGYYLCSTIIYVHEMKKHIVIFQAIIKSLTAEQFCVLL